MRVKEESEKVGLNTSVQKTKIMASDPIAAAAAKSLQSCPTLCNPIDSSPPGSPVSGILQARTLEWVVISYSRASSQPRDQTHISCVSYTGRWIIYH